jgi:hypothetical protein
MDTGTHAPPPTVQIRFGHDGGSLVIPRVTASFISVGRGTAPSSRLSEFFFDRMRRELFILFVQARNENVQSELDEEVERITGKECDDAARALSKEEFRKVAEEAMRNIRKRRQKTPEEKSSVEVSAYR